MDQIKNEYLNAKSIHIFECTFVYGDKEKKEKRKTKKKIEKEEIIQNIEHNGWKRKILKIDRTVDKGKIDKDVYMLENYFSKEALDVFVSDKKECDVYYFPLNSEYEYMYSIEKNGIVYDLKIKELELHLYNTGIGELFIKTINTNSNLDVEDIKNINDYGRRMFLPFYPDDMKYSICADRISVVVKNKENNIKHFNLDFLENPMANGYDAIVKNIINGRLDNTYDTKELDFEPIADDRLFVISMIRDEELSENIAKQAWYEDYGNRDLLYSLFYVDPDETTCQSDDMRESMLKQSVYDRWLKYGTIYGITDYSLIGITTERMYVNDLVIKPFWIEYLYMVSLVIAQKESIGLFSEKAGKLAKSVNEIKKLRSIFCNKEREINELNTTYIEFINRVLILKFTNQQQGKEMYAIAQKQLNVLSQKKYVEEELNGLYKIASVGIKIKHEIINRVIELGLSIGIYEVVFKIIKLIIDWFN